MIGTEVGSYRILEKLGEGGMGVVYKALDTSLDRLVAIKVLSAQLAGSPELVQRFRAEAKAQANLNHTNLATLYAFLVQDGSASMVMEFVDGETLEQMVARRGPIPSEEAIPLFRQALLGIGYAHRNGIVHRDIKPSNLMVNRSGIVKVMDFGIAKVMGVRGMTKTGTQMGTGWYMSPEQVLNKNVDIRSDIYSLGVTLYQLVTGHVPFEGDSDFKIMSDHVSTPPPLPTRFYPYIPKGVENAVLKALEKNPDARFQTVEEFGAALERPNDFSYAAETPGNPRPATIAETWSAPAPPAYPPANQPQASRPATNPPIASLPAATPPQSLQPGKPLGLFATPQRKIVAGGIAALLVLGAIAVTKQSNKQPESVYTPSGNSQTQNSVAPGQTPLEQQLSSGGLASEMSAKQQKSSAAAAAVDAAARKAAQNAQAERQAAATKTPPPPARPAAETYSARATPPSAPDPGMAPIPAPPSPPPQQRAQVPYSAPEPPPQRTPEAPPYQPPPAPAARNTPAPPAGQARLLFSVMHDHTNPLVQASRFGNCWGQLRVMGNNLEYRVIGTNDGRNDSFTVPLSSIGEVKANRVPIRNQPAFHIVVNGQHYNFLTPGMSAAQAAATVQQVVQGH
jgi:serine/threonine-protein kinase